MRQLAFAILIAVIGTVSCSSSDGNKTINGTSDVVNNDISTNTSIDESGKTVQLNKAMFIDKIWNYEENSQNWVYKSDMPGLIDFYADWCGPCKITAPILDELAEEYKGKIVIYKVNVDKEKELASVFGVSSLPTFLYMPKDGEPTASSGIGRSAEATKKMFIDQIEEILLKQ